MLRTMMVTVVTLVAVLAVPAMAVDHHSWRTGKVLDSRLAKASVAEGSTTNTNGTATATGFGGVATASGESTSTTRLDFANIRDNQLVILRSEFAFVVEDTRVSGGQYRLAHAIANRHHGCRFIVGDDVRYWQEKATLHVVDADGKECKVDVLRQEQVK